MRNGLRVLLGALVVLLPFANAHAASAQTFGPHIQRYDVVIQLDRDGTMHVRESIGYDFDTVPRHGIFRDIPRASTTTTRTTASIR